MGWETYISHRQGESAQHMSGQALFADSGDGGVTVMAHLPEDMHIASLEEAHHVANVDGAQALVLGGVGHLGW